jgi:ParB/RepB/Spo0J family partition protein
MQKIKLFQISKLKENPENPNIMSKDKLNALINSINLLGELQPIIVDQTGTIVDGHHRVKAYKEIGKTEIAGYEIDVTIHQRRKILQAMNKVRGEHSQLKDALEIQKILQEETLQDFSELIGESEDTILKLMDSLKREDETKMVSFEAKLTKAQSWTFIATEKEETDIINNALNKTGEKNSSKAFIIICKKYLL